MHCDWFIVLLLLGDLLTLYRWGVGVGKGENRVSSSSFFSRAPRSLLQKFIRKKKNRFVERLCRYGKVQRQLAIGKTLLEGGGTFDHQVKIALF